MSERTHWIILRKPGNIPIRKGPFSPRKELGEFIREVMAGRPGEFITVLAMQDGEPEIYDGPEWLEGRDGRSAPLARKHRESTRCITLAEALTKDARIAALEARILELETVTDDDVERAAKAYDDACMTTTFAPCPRCNGKGYHHGFGEHGTDPDWCDNCAGGGEIDADPLKPIRAALSTRRGDQ